MWVTVDSIEGPVANVGAPSGYLIMPTVIDAVVGDEHTFTFRGVNTSGAMQHMGLMCSVYDHNGTEIGQCNHTSHVDDEAEISSTITVSLDIAGVYTASCWLSVEV